MNTTQTTAKLHAIKTVTVKGSSAILHKGSTARIQHVGDGVWLILESNGASVDPATLFLIEGRDF